MSLTTQHQLGKKVTAEGWSSEIILDDQCFEEINLLRNQLLECNGQLIRNTLSSGKIMDLEEVQLRTLEIKETTQDIQHLLSQILPIEQLLFIIMER